MRWLACVLFLGCSSSEVATNADSGRADSASTDTAPSVDSAPGDAADAMSTECTPGAVNTLSGELPNGSSTPRPAWEAKSVLRIDRASAPSRPFVIFLSKPVTCSAFADAEWINHIDSAAFVYVELGNTALATYPASKADPPPATLSYIAHGSGYEMGGIGFPQQYTEDGGASVTAYSSTSIAGTFTAGFVGDPTKPLVRLCGRFEATPCAVTW